ncbi:MAG: mercuric reductase [Pirellulaceae bacterium]
MGHEIVPLTPYDEYNQQLEANVRPPQWTNPTPTKPYHFVVIGAGTAGLVTAAGAAGLGARVALIERQLMGGDCLNVGCVPSKGIIRAARVAATVRDASALGVHPGEVRVSFAEAMQRMRRLRAKISPADSARRFAKLGVDVFFGTGTFLKNDTVTVTGPDGTASTLQFKKAVIATGARASAPTIPGLDTVEYLTNESLYSLTELPTRLGVIGAGPIGCEMAQAFARLGSQVFLFEGADQVLSREDPEASAILRDEFERDGIRLLLDSQDMSIAGADGGAIRISVRCRGQRDEVVVDQLLVAVGRAPNTDGLNLDAAGVKYDRSGVVVNDFLQTTNPHIYAAGDICSKYKFTHAADFMARIVIQNALFAIGPIGKRRASRLVIPRTTYTSPEVAHVGIDPRDAKRTGMEVDTYVQQLVDVDRAVLDGQDHGFVKIHTRKGTDRIIGATIVADHAGDLISGIVLAMSNGVGLGKIASAIHPYPTQAEAIRKLGDQFNRKKLTPINQRILGFLRRLNVGD